MPPPRRLSTADLKPNNILLSPLSGGVKIIRLTVWLASERVKERYRATPSNWRPNRPFHKMGQRAHDLFNFGSTCTAWHWRLPPWRFAPVGEKAAWKPERQELEGLFQRLPGLAPQAPPRPWRPGFPPLPSWDGLQRPRAHGRWSRAPSTNLVERTVVAASAGETAWKRSKVDGRHG